MYVYCNKTFKKYVELCKSYVSPDMILDLKFDAKMEPKSCKHGSKMSKVAPKCPQNVPLEASKWARRPQDGSRGAKMVSMTLRELPNDSQDGPKVSQVGSYGAPNMTPRGAKMIPKVPKVSPR